MLLGCLNLQPRLRIKIASGPIPRFVVFSSARAVQSQQTRSTDKEARRTTRTTSATETTWHPSKETRTSPSLSPLPPLEAQFGDLRGQTIFSYSLLISPEGDYTTCLASYPRRDMDVRDIRGAERASVNKVTTMDISRTFE